ncbi:MAG: flagellar type III secretion system pore protein FliP [Candidatus Lernaella stagnicola]|nr:flagellar type III secretion system pore protein FliP [Candidatus Lernaella stagnicola]
MRVIVTVIIGIVLLVAWAGPAMAQQAGGVAMAPSSPIMPQITIGVGQANSPDQISTALKIMLLLTVLALVPSFLVMLTSFTRIVVVLSFMRQALGTHQTPTNQIVLGLALFLTVFIMFPVWTQINQNALKPYMDQQIGYEEAIENAMEPLRVFMFKHTREKDLGLFLKISNQPKPRTITDVPTIALVPAFVVSELKTAFTIGFLIWLPFLIVDMVIASVLMSMGMLMLPPIMISLPFKLLVFVLADGWYLLIGSLVNSFVT